VKALGAGHGVVVLDDRRLATPKRCPACRSSRPRPRPVAIRAALRAPHRGGAALCRLARRRQPCATGQYYENNVTGSLALPRRWLPKACVAGSRRPARSTTQALPLTEDHPTVPVNARRIETGRGAGVSTSRRRTGCAIALRYFSAAGAVPTAGSVRITPGST
jgi:hypothetical protein